ncbi:MAG: phosphoribosylformylglycinamidine synthase subunit PurQ, partial [Clostridia bacterium]|nr:phosphoribosylformylglycinamidine synthase subunit PurQ [Clostridia bacterium]
NSNGAEKHIEISAAPVGDYSKKIPADFSGGMMALASDLNVCSKRGLSERFDSTIGAGSVLMPFGGKNQLTPTQAMVNKISLEKGDTDTCSVMSYGYNPFITSKDPFAGAYLAVVESLCKLIATGADFKDTYLTFQEYFEKPGRDGKRWGKPLAALLGAFKAQMDFGVASIGGKDSMSGSFEKLDVPPTLVSFAVTTDKIGNIISPEFKAAGHKVIILAPEVDEKGLPTAESLKLVFDYVSKLVRSGKVYAAYTPTYGGIAEAVFKMGIGNGIGFKYEKGIGNADVFSYNYGTFLLEVADDVEGQVIGHTTEEKTICLGGECVCMDELLKLYEDKLEGVYSCNIKQTEGDIPTFSYKAESWAKPAVKVAKPKILIPVFPGTNCEYESAKALERAGAEAEIIVIKNLTASAIEESVAYFAKRVESAQGIFIPGGFSGGDEPEGSGKFITAFFRNAAVKEATMELLKNRDGMMLGICNGFQALIKLGLVPYGEIIDTDENCPTLTFNTIGRHQSRIVRTRIASNKSPWLMKTEVGDIHNVPISHGEGRFIAPEAVIAQLAENGQIATQYVDLSGKPTANVSFNPNDSMCAIEGITSPDGRVLGKMGHSERVGSGLYKNVEGNYDTGLFESFVEYFK